MKTCRFCGKTFDKVDVCLKHEFICQDENKFTLKKVNFNSFTGEFQCENILARKDLFEKDFIELDEYNHTSQNGFVNEKIDNNYLEEVLSSDNLNYCIYTMDFSKEHEIECNKKLIDFDIKNKKTQIDQLEKIIHRNKQMLKGNFKITNDKIG